MAVRPVVAQDASKSATVVKSESAVASVSVKDSDMRDFDDRWAYEQSK